MRIQLLHPSQLNRPWTELLHASYEQQNIITYLKPPNICNLLSLSITSSLPAWSKSNVSGSPCEHAAVCDCGDIVVLYTHTLILLRADKECCDEALVTGITNNSFMVVHTDESTTLSVGDRTPRMQTTSWIVMLQLMPSLSDSAFSRGSWASSWGFDSSSLLKSQT